MKNRLILMGSVLTMFAAAPASAQDFPDFDEPVGPTLPAIPAWTDPTATQINREPPRTEFITYDTREKALENNYETSNYFQQLQGAWRVRTLDAQAEPDSALLRPDLDLSGWTEVQLPQAAPLRAPMAVYRREFKMPFVWDGRQIFLHMGRVSGAYYVYVNGQLAGYSEDSKAPSEFDITRLVEEGMNSLAIVAYAEPDASVLENQLTTSGTRVAGDLYILAQPRIRIRDYTVTTQFDPTGTAGLLNFGVQLKTHLLNPRDMVIHFELIDPDGQTVTTFYRDAGIDMRDELPIYFFQNIPNIRKWSHEDPSLYTVLVKLQHEGRFTEYAAFKVGFRTVSADSGRLRINGAETPLRVAEYAPSEDTATWRADLQNFRRDHINMLIIKNYPCNRHFYDLCDELGMYVCNQTNLDSRRSGASTAVGGTPANDPAWEAAHTDRVMNMYYTSKNHPSVVAFSLGGEAGNGYNLYEAYLKLKAIETERPVVYLNAGTQWNTDMTSGSAPDAASRPILRASDPVAARAYCPVAITAVNAAQGRFRLMNNYDFTPSRDLHISYEVYAGKRKRGSGTVDTAIAPGDSGEFTIPYGKVKPGLQLNVVFTVTGPDGTVVCTQPFNVTL